MRVLIILLLSVCFMNFFRLSNESITGSTEWRNCHNQLFCARYRFLAQHQARKETLFRYQLLPESIQVHEANITGILKLTGPSVFLANELKLSLKIFENGILHTLIDDDMQYVPKNGRFRISDFDAVEWNQLKPDLKASIKVEADHVVIKSRDNKHDLFTFKVYYDPFLVVMLVNGENVMEVNYKDLLYFENKKIPLVTDINYENDILNRLMSTMVEEDKREVFSNRVIKDEPNFDFRESIALSFKMNSQFLYGLPERAERLLLKSTENSNPYRLYNLDIFKHQPYSNQNLYGSIPYITAHTDEYDTSIVWMNSAETFVEIFNKLEDQKESEFEDRLVTMLSESGMMEFFIFGSSVNNGGPKSIAYKLALITGFQSLPPYFSLGFHYSKWEPISTEIISNLLDEFNRQEMPLDVYWMDIDYTSQNKYFELDQERFFNFESLIQKMEEQEKRITIITDPHIKVASDFFVFKEGKKIEAARDITGLIEKGAFIRDKTGQSPFFGDCWPENSVWIDFLNDNASKFWSSLYRYDKFQRTTKIFSFWIDMNEPSVFSGDELTLPKNAYHMTSDYEFYMHRDFHNAYGLLMQKATYRGIIEREQDQNLRPFMLTRAVFFGSQKYGAMWTGDNQAQVAFLGLSIQMCLSLAVSGISFCGADVGGFTGYSPPELINRWYQHAVFQPFFRAHGHSTTDNREPWKQGQYAKLLKEYVHLRHSIIPYIYTQFYIASTTGVPVMRPLWMEYPTDNLTFAVDTNYMFGESLLVSATFPQLDHFNLYLPKQDHWYSFFYGKLMDPMTGPALFQANPDQMGVFVKAGTIMLRKYRKKLSALQTLNDDYFLEIYPNPDTKEASSILYIDDGETFNYKRTNTYNLVEFKYLSDGTLEINLIHSNYTRDISFRIQAISIYNVIQTPSRVMIKQGDDFNELRPDQVKYISQEHVLVLRQVDIDIMKEDQGGVIQVISESYNRRSDL